MTNLDLQYQEYALRALGITKISPPLACDLNTLLELLQMAVPFPADSTELTIKNNLRMIVNAIRENESPRAIENLLIVLKNEIDFLPFE